MQAIAWTVYLRSVAEQQADNFGHNKYINMQSKCEDTAYFDICTKGFRYREIRTVFYHFITL